MCLHCEVCNRTFFSSALYEEHFLREHTFVRGGANGDELIKPDLTPLTTLTSPTAAAGNSSSAASAIVSPSTAVAASSSANTVDSAMRQSILNLVYQCEYCKEIFQEQNLLTKHLDSVHPETFALPTEPLPPQSLTEFEPLAALEAAAAEEGTAALAGQPNIGLNEQIFYQCLLCQELFMDSASLQAHMENSCAVAQKQKQANVAAAAASAAAATTVTVAEPAVANEVKIEEHPVVVTAVEPVTTAEPTVTTAKTTEETVQLLPGDGSSLSNVLYECNPCNLLFAEKKGLEEHVAVKGCANGKESGDAVQTATDLTSRIKADS